MGGSQRSLRDSEGSDKCEMHSDCGAQRGGERHGGAGEVLDEQTLPIKEAQGVSNWVNMTTAAPGHIIFKLLNTLSFTLKILKAAREKHQITHTQCCKHWELIT